MTCEDFYGLFDIGDLQDTGGLSAFGTGGAICVRDIDMGLRELLGDIGQRPGLVRKGYTQNIGLAERHIELFQDIADFDGRLGDHPHNAMFDRIHHGNSDEINPRIGNFSEHLRENAGLVYHEHRVLSFYTHLLAPLLIKLRFPVTYRLQGGGPVGIELENPVEVRDLEDPAKLWVYTAYQYNAAVIAQLSPDVNEQPQHLR